MKRDFRESEREEERTRVGHGDVTDFIGVKPDLSLATLEDACGEPLLELQRNHVLPPPVFSFGN